MHELRVYRQAADLRKLINANYRVSPFDSVHDAGESHEIACQQLTHVETIQTSISSPMIITSVFSLLQKERREWLFFIVSFKVIAIKRLQLKSISTLCLHEQLFVFAESHANSLLPVTHSLFRATRSR